ncbi:MAG: phytanoyl-CoA dioxygenase family protein [Myxococcota bacterium]|nr:phytanoyl-CoA dioxygenase family protein [Myxococcota bacterium]
MSNEKMETMVEVLPWNTKFQLGPVLTPKQCKFLEVYGFLHFEGVASEEEVARIISETERIEGEWRQENRSKVNGIPLFWGRDGLKRPYLQRWAFTSMFSPYISDFVTDGRFEAIRKCFGEDARVGEREKDGVVVNRYLNTPESTRTRLGWHNDGLRDLFYLRMPQEMLNVGLHLDDCTVDDGGLRLIPGTQKQGFLKMCLYKPHFIGHGVDRHEICVETKAGDLTIHDGRLWHRVARSKFTGERSLRRTMFVPYLTGPYEPKNESSATPAYHTLGQVIRFVRNAVQGVLRRFLKPFRRPNLLT